MTPEPLASLQERLRQVQLALHANRVERERLAHEDARLYGLIWLQKAQEGHQNIQDVTTIPEAKVTPTPPPGAYFMRCVWCWSPFPGVWYASPLFGECKDCREWWNYCQAQKHDTPCRIQE